jgi:hypothetical protein
MEEKRLKEEIIKLLYEYGQATLVTKAFVPEIDFVPLADDLVNLFKLFKENEQKDSL